MTNICTILIADDDRISRMILRRQLELLGCQVIEAENGGQVLVILEQLPLPHLIILDYAMPVMNGLAVLAALKNNPHWQVIPIMLLTGSDNETKKRQVMESGADYYMIKPVDSALLAPIIHSLMEHL